MRVDVLVCKILAFVLSTLGIAITSCTCLFIEAVNSANFVGFVVASCLGVFMAYAGIKLMEW